MKKVLVIISLLLSLNAFGQDCVKMSSGAYVITIGKDGKSTVKECQWVTICPGVVEFRVSGTSVATFTKITEAKWEKLGSSKVTNVATKPATADNKQTVIIFQETPKKAFYYYPQK